MTQAISSPELSVYSLPSYDDEGTLEHRIAQTYERLRIVMGEEARLKTALYELLTEQVAQASEQLEQAQIHCKVIMEKQAEMRKHIGEGMEPLSSPTSSLIHPPRLKPVELPGGSQPQSPTFGASETSSILGLSDVSHLSTPLSVTRSSSISAKSSISSRGRVHIRIPSSRRWEPAGSNGVQHLSRTIGIRAKNILNGDDPVPRARFRRPTVN